MKLWGIGESEKEKDTVIKQLLEENRIWSEKFRVLSGHSRGKVAQFNVHRDSLTFTDNQTGEQVTIGVKDREALKQSSKNMQLYPKLLEIVACLKERILAGEQEIVEVLEGKIGEEKGWGKFTAVVVKDSQGSPVQAVCIMEDSTENLEREAQLEIQITDILDERKKLRMMADMDLLTNLYNKVTTAELIDNMLEECPDLIHAFMIFDLDNFKQVNDTLGHAAGDEVLIAVAKILSSHFRSTDIVGRIGGDEFAALMTDVGNSSLAQNKAENIRSIICSGADPDIPEFVSTSIGIAMSSSRCSFRELYKKADRALYDAKRAGKNQFKIYRE